jgi:hypothetical protein
MAALPKKGKLGATADSEGPRPKNQAADPSKAVPTTGAVDMHHPDYDEHIGDWRMMRDAIAGDRAVKGKNKDYLPIPDGFTMQSDGGKKMYDDYRDRAQFPRVVEPTLRGMLGVIHRKEADIKMPKAMEYLWEKATKDGLPLEGFHRRITRELLATGRYGVFVDMASTGDGDPYLCGYDAEHLINWSEFGDFYVLDETRDVRDGFAWIERKKFRVLEMVATNPDDDATDPDVERSYKVQVYDGQLDSANAKVFEPTVRGGGNWDEIPFVVIGCTDVMIPIDQIPLLGVAQAAFATYRLDADYRHQLYMSGQETLAITKIRAEDRPRVVGAGVILTLPDGATAEYVSPSCSGIDAHKAAIDDELAKAAQFGAKLFSASEGKQAESGDALKVRFAGQTATLTSIAIASAMGLERALKKVAKFMGLDPDDVVVTPNLSFVDSVLTGSDALNLVKIWQASVISKQTLYEALQRGEIASSERSFEDEQALIEDEVPPPTTGLMGPNGLMVPPPNDAQLNAFRQGGPLPPSSGKKPPQAGRPGVANPKKPPAGAPASNKGKPPSKKTI